MALKKVLVISLCLVLATALGGGKYISQNAYRDYVDHHRRPTAHSILTAYSPHHSAAKNSNESPYQGPISWKDAGDSESPIQAYHNQTRRAVAALAVWLAGRDSGPGFGGSAPRDGRPAAYNARRLYIEMIQLQV